MPPRRKENDPNPNPKVKVVWVKKVPRKRNPLREKNLELARQIARYPKKWAMLRAYPPDDRGYKSADARANEYRKKDSAFSKVGRFQFSIRFDAGFMGDYHTRAQRKDERGAWLLIGRCMEPHKLDARDPNEYEIAGWEFTDDPEEQEDIDGSSKQEG
jgi:hypothetical protein